VLADRFTGIDNAYAGSKISTRLKVAGITVVALGERDARDGDEAVSALSHDGKFRRAIARDGMLVGAQVVGDAAAAAALGKAFDRKSPLAGSLAALLFGNDGIAGTATAASARSSDELVCICNEIPRTHIEGAIAAGAHDVAAIGRVTLAGTGCGTCRGQLSEMVIAAQTAGVP
jgi:nitrite reductase (NADH) large subunit